MGGGGEYSCGKGRVRSLAFIWVCGEFFGVETDRFRICRRERVF